MHVLLCGASGFIGRHLRSALVDAGHTVTVAGRHAGASGAIAADFVHDTSASAWVPRLAGMDAVVNAVGVLRDSPQYPMKPIHELTPIALFDACAQAGVQRVIHISALGIEGNPTAYARTKLRADAHLLALNAQGRLRGVVLRPSIVFGAGGDSARLFLMLAHSPALLLPRAVLRAKAQPVAVQDLARAVARLLQEASSVQGVVPCVGPTPLTLAGFIACLREQLGHRPAHVAPLPDVLSRWSARLGDHIPVMPWCSETLALLAQDNVADPALFTGVLGHTPVAPGALLQEVARP